MNKINLITGDDPFAIQEFAKKLVQCKLVEDQDELSIEIYKEDENKSQLQIIEDVLISLQTPPFLVSKKTLWLQNLTILSEFKSSTPGKKSMIASFMLLRTGAEEHISFRMELTSCFLASLEAIKIRL